MGEGEEEEEEEKEEKEEKEEGREEEGEHQEEVECSGQPNLVVAVAPGHWAVKVALLLRQMCQCCPHQLQLAGLFHPQSALEQEICWDVSLEVQETCYDVFLEEETCCGAFSKVQEIDVFLEGETCCDVQCSFSLNEEP